MTFQENCKQWHGLISMPIGAPALERQRESFYTFLNNGVYEDTTPWGLSNIVTPSKLARYVRKAVDFLRANPQNHNQSLYFSTTEEKIPNWCVIGKVMYDIICDFGLAEKHIYEPYHQTFFFKNHFEVQQDLNSILGVESENPISMLNRFFPKINDELSWCKVAVSGEYHALMTAEKILAHYGY